MLVEQPAAALQTQRDQLALETGRLRARVVLIRALGGGWTVGDPVEQVR